MNARSESATDAYRRAIQGAVAGALATVPMTFAILGMQRVLPFKDRIRELPFAQVTRRVETKMPISDNLLRRLHPLVVAAGHFGFGASAGAVYGTFCSSRTNSRFPGSAFGLTVWGLSYM